MVCASFSHILLCHPSCCVIQQDPVKALTDTSAFVFSLVGMGSCPVCQWPILLLTYLQFQQFGFRLVSCLSSALVPWSQDDFCKWECVGRFVWEGCPWGDFAWVEVLLCRRQCAEATRSVLFKYLLLGLCKAEYTQVLTHLKVVDCLTHKIHLAKQKHHWKGPKESGLAWQTHLDEKNSSPVALRGVSSKWLSFVFPWAWVTETAGLDQFWPFLASASLPPAGFLLWDFVPFSGRGFPFKSFSY